MMKFLERFAPKRNTPEWERKVVPLTPDACELIARTLEQNGGLNSHGFGASVTAMSIINQTIFEEWGPILKSMEQNGAIPVPAEGLQLLIDDGKLDLSQENIARKYEEYRAKQ